MEVIVENIKYQLDTENKTAKVIDYKDEPVEVIIPDFIEYENKKYKVTEIGNWAFFGCCSLHSVIITNSVTSIGNRAFYQCSSLTSIDIPNSVNDIGLSAFDKIGLFLPKRYTKNGKLIAYKAFRSHMTCIDFQYEEGKSYEIKGKIQCCYRGFHACTNPLNIFNYYWGGGLSVQISIFMRCI